MSFEFLNIYVFWFSIMFTCIFLSFKAWYHVSEVFLRIIGLYSECVCVFLERFVIFVCSFLFPRLVEPRDVVFECGPRCGCGPSCLNRTSQRGLKYQLEVI